MRWNRGACLTQRWPLACRNIAVPCSHMTGWRNSTKGWSSTFLWAATTTTFEILASLKSWRLSPVYDVLPQPSIASERFQHLVVGESGRLATLDNAPSGHEALQLSEAFARKLMADVWQVVRDWRPVFENLGVDPRDIDAVQPAFRHVDDVSSADLRRALPWSSGGVMVTFEMTNLWPRRRGAETGKRRTANTKSGNKPFLRLFQLASRKRRTMSCSRSCNEMQQELLVSARGL
ncbi:hypothetical protein AWB66_06384 [Caballeronia telluris]|uniref:Uncharacterized protein n=1 Tax=Caballeronia telluris TaxID=326475 RepID=A0A158KJ48_9BURK|nr:hypothetical protein AWB66_06384 [Caballeronia telluris]